MRLWSIHPKYLDSKGLVAVWREGLLAKKVLEGKTKGYTNHSQLIRFKNTNDQIISINQYLLQIYTEAKLRSFNFDKSKIDTINTKIVQMPVTSMQVQYEFELLKYKLSKRDKLKYAQLIKINKYELNPLFYSIIGQIENWEKIIPEIEGLLK
jgi:hypothetical protein